MRLDPEEDREPIASMVRDGFQTPELQSVPDTCKHIMTKVRDHGGKWPAYMTGSYSQCRHWERDMSMFAPALPPSRTVLTIMNVKVIERPGPVTLIWSEPLT